MDQSQLRSLLAEAFNSGRQLGQREGAAATSILHQLFEKAQAYEEAPSEAKARPDAEAQAPKAQSPKARDGDA